MRAYIVEWAHMSEEDGERVVFTRKRDADRFLADMARDDAEDESAWEYLQKPELLALDIPLTKAAMLNVLAGVIGPYIVPPHAEPRTKEVGP